MNSKCKQWWLDNDVRGRASGRSPCMQSWRAHCRNRSYVVTKVRRGARDGNRLHLEHVAKAQHAQQEGGEEKAGSIAHFPGPRPHAHHRHVQPCTHNTQSQPSFVAAQKVALHNSHDAAPVPTTSTCVYAHKVPSSSDSSMGCCCCSTHHCPPAALHAEYSKSAFAHVGANVAQQQCKSSTLLVPCHYCHLQPCTSLYPKKCCMRRASSHCCDLLHH